MFVILQSTLNNLNIVIEDSTETIKNFIEVMNEPESQELLVSSEDIASIGNITRDIESLGSSECINKLEFTVDTTCAILQFSENDSDFIKQLHYRHMCGDNEMLYTFIINGGKYEYTGYYIGDSNGENVEEDSEDDENENDNNEYDNGRCCYCFKAISSVLGVGLATNIVIAQYEKPYDPWSHYYTYNK